MPSPPPWRASAAPWPSAWWAMAWCPLRSALGLHDDTARTLAFAPDHQRVLHGLGHLALLSDARVARQLVQWLATPGI